VTDLSMTRRRIDPAGWTGEAVRQGGLEGLSGRYYGLYTALVVDNLDPEKRGRVRLQIPALNQVEPADVPPNWWALPCMPGLASGTAGQMHGLFTPPEAGDCVWVMFEGGNPCVPVYLGGWLPQAAAGTPLTAAGGALRRGLRTPAGHFLRFSDKGDDLHVTLAKGDGDGDTSGAVITLDKDGGILVMAENGAHLAINAQDGAITVMNVEPDGEGSKATSWVTLGKDSALVATVSGSHVALNGKDVSINAPGDLTLTAGGKVWLNSGAVRLGKGPNFEPAVRGKMLDATLKQWATAHQHIAPAGTAGGITAPGPIPPPVLVEFNQLSETVTLS
jgi:hypothetical protein